MSPCRQLRPALLRARPQDPDPKEMLATPLLCWVLPRVPEVRVPPLLWAWPRAMLPLRALWGQVRGIPSKAQNVPRTCAGLPCATSGCWTPAGVQGAGEGEEATAYV